MKHPGNVSSSAGRVLRAFRLNIASQKARLIGGVIFVLLATVMDVLQPWPLKFIYDHVFGKSGSHLGVWPALQAMDSRVLLGVLSLSFIVIAATGTAALISQPA